MCGRIVYVWDPVTKQLVERIVDDADFDAHTQHVLEKKRYNVPPASHLPVIAQHGEGVGVDIARWGFPIPQRPNGVFNTRIETAFESPMWKGLIGSHRCLFPVKGFYEWTQDKRKTPHFIHRTDGDSMLLGGVIGQRTWNGESLTCASVVTCEPNPLLAGLHDRMPVVIETADAASWLQPGAGAALELALPAADGVLAMHPVGRAVGDTGNDSPGLMAPIASTGLDAFSD